MRTESTLAMVAFGCAAVAPCTMGVSAGAGVVAALAGLVVAERAKSSVLLPVLALLANLGALAFVVVLAIVAALTLAVGALATAAAAAMASAEVAEEIPHAARTVVGALSPAGFWGAYRHDEIVDHESSQGPWGGWRELHWVAKEGERFNEDDALEFATDHGWVLHWRETVGPNGKRQGKPLCLLPSGECCPELDHIPAGNLLQMLPASMRMDRQRSYLLLSFASGLCSEADSEPPGHVVNGFVILSNDGRHMVVRHHWGS